jgi:hypothetical protein
MTTRRNLGAAATALVATAALALGSQTLLGSADAATTAANPGGPATGTAAKGTAQGTTFLTVATTMSSAKNPEHARPLSNALVRVDADGTRTTLYSSHVDADGRGALQLEDTAGKLALVSVWGLNGTHGTQGTGSLVAVNTTTGAHRTVPVVRRFQSALLEPDGSGVVEVQDAKGEDAQPYHLVRVDFDGTRTPFPSVSHDDIWLTATGDVLATTGWKHATLNLIDGKTGALLHTFSTGRQHCQPVRSWDRTRALLSCTGLKSSGDYATLEAFDPVSGAISSVTVPHSHKDGHGAFLGDLDARVTRSGTYVLEAGPCGVVFFTRQYADRSMREVKVPGATGNVVLVGASGGLPVIEHADSCDMGAGIRYSLDTWNPKTRTQHRIALFGKHQVLGSVDPLGERRASSW